MDRASADLVLLPGLDGTGLLFAPFVRALSGFREPRVVEYPQDRKLSLLELSEIVLQRLPQEAVVVAESFSGLVALSLIQRAPSRLRGVMISGTRFRKFGSGVPACYLRATRDRLVPAGCATWFEEHFDSCSVVDVPGPHFLLQANPEGCKQEIQSFLDRISA